MTRAARAIAVAAAVTTSTLTAAAWADPSSSGQPGTPLVLRAVHPVDLPTNSSNATVAKLLLVGLVAGFGFWAWRQRTSSRASVREQSLRILRRTSVGVRSELLLVEVEGQRLLLGVTPSSVQNLYILGNDTEAETLDSMLPEPAPSLPASVPHPGDGPRKGAAHVGSRRPAPRQEQATGMEEQARGISAFADRR